MCIVFEFRIYVGGYENTIDIVIDQTIVFKSMTKY